MISVTEVSRRGFMKLLAGAVAGAAGGIGLLPFSNWLKSTERTPPELAKERNVRWPERVLGRAVQIRRERASTRQNPELSTSLS